MIFKKQDDFKERGGNLSEGRNSGGIELYMMLGEKGGNALDREFYTNCRDPTPHASTDWVVTMLGFHRSYRCLRGETGP